MSDQMTALFAMMRELTATITSRLDEFEEKIDALSAQNSGTKGSDIERLEEYLQFLGIAVGRVHANQNYDEALPQDLLNHQLMTKFMENYPENGPSPLDEKYQAKLKFTRDNADRMSSDKIIPAYSKMREQQSLTNTDLYYCRETEAVLAKEMQSRGEDLFTGHEPLDPRIKPILEQEKVLTKQQLRDHRLEQGRGR